MQSPCAAPGSCPRRSGWSALPTSGTGQWTPLELTGSTVPAALAHLAPRERSSVLNTQGWQPDMPLTVNIQRAIYSNVGGNGFGAGYYK